MKQTRNIYALIIGLLIMIPTQNINSQAIKPYTPPTPKGFIGLGWGINDYGIGLGAEVQLKNNLWFYMMGGVSGWGYRLTGGCTYYPGSNAYGSSFSLGYSYASGMKDFTTTLDVESSSTQEEMDVTLDLNAINTINLIYSYNVKVGRKSKFVFSGGYAITSNNELYTKQSPSNELTEESEDFIKFMAPGGVIIGIKYMFGNL